MIDLSANPEEVDEEKIIAEQHIMEEMCVICYCLFLYDISDVNILKCV